MKNNKKSEYHIHRILLYILGIILFSYFLISIIFRSNFEDKLRFIIVGVIAIIVCIYSLITELFPYILKDNKENDINPTDDLSKTPKSILEEYNILASDSSFLYDGEEYFISVDSLEDKYSGFELTFSSEKHSFIVDLFVGTDLIQFLNDEELKETIVDNLYKIMKKNKEKCRKLLIDNEYRNIYEWIHGSSFDTTDSKFYTGDLEEEEFKDLLLNNLDLEIYSITLNQDFEIKYITYVSYVQSLCIELGFDVNNGKVDYDSIYTHLSLG